jgi:hypothetical protein
VSVVIDGSTAPSDWLSEDLDRLDIELQRLEGDSKPDPAVTRALDRIAKIVTSLRHTRAWIRIQEQGGDDDHALNVVPIDGRNTK